MLKPVAIVLLVVSALLFGGGAVRLATAPAEPAFPGDASHGDAWFEAGVAHDKAVFFGIGLLMAGFVFGGTAAMMLVLSSRSVRKAGLGLVSDVSEAIAAGQARAAARDHA
jgi:hypothetical protein